MLKERGSSARGTDAPWYRGWDLTETQRAIFRATTLESQAAKKRAINGQCTRPKHAINLPRLDPSALMPQLPQNGLRALSFCSGGGGLDIGFERVGFAHVASFDILEDAAAVLRNARPRRRVFDGEEGDVTRVDWRTYRNSIDVLHGGPPCQPFSHAGRRNGPEDVRDLIPEFVRAASEIQPRAFVFENVLGLIATQFSEYIRKTLIDPLHKSYWLERFILMMPIMDCHSVAAAFSSLGLGTRLLRKSSQPQHPLIATRNWSAAKEIGGSPERWG